MLSSDRQLVHLTLLDRKHLEGKKVCCGEPPHAASSLSVSTCPMEHIIVPDILYLNLHWKVARITSF